MVQTTPVTNFTFWITVIIAIISGITGLFKYCTLAFILLAVAYVWLLIGCLTKGR